MILAIDIGNTTVALGGIRDGRVCFVAPKESPLSEKIVTWIEQE